MPRLRVAPGLAIGASADGVIRLPLWTGSSCPPHAVRTYMRSETSSKSSDVVRPAWDTPAAIACSRCDSDSTSVRSEEEVGDEDEEDDGGAAGKHTIRLGCCRRFTN